MTEWKTFSVIYWCSSQLLSIHNKRTENVGIFVNTDNFSRGFLNSEFQKLDLLPTGLRVCTQLVPLSKKLLDTKGRFTFWGAHLSRNLENWWLKHILFLKICLWKDARWWAMSKVTVILTVTSHEHKHSRLGKELAWFINCRV